MVFPKRMAVQDDPMNTVPTLDLVPTLSHADIDYRLDRDSRSNTQDQTMQDQTTQDIEYESARAAFEMENEGTVGFAVHRGGTNEPAPAALIYASRVQITDSVDTPARTNSDTGVAIAQRFLLPPPGVRYLTYQFVLRRPANQLPMQPLGIRVAIVGGVPGCFVTRIYAGGLANRQNGLLRSYRAIGLDQRTLSPGNRIMHVNGDTSHEGIKHHLAHAPMLHLLIHRIRPAVAAVAIIDEARARAFTIPAVFPPPRASVLPPAATPLPKAFPPPPAMPEQRGHAPPPPEARAPPRLSKAAPPLPPRTSILGPGPWPTSARDLCALFGESTNVEIDLDHAFMNHKIKDEPILEAWFALEVRRIWVRGRCLNAIAHITLMTGGRSVVEQTQNIASVFQQEYEHWKRPASTGLTGVLRRPPDNYRSSKRHYSWLLILPGSRVYEMLNQAVARAEQVYAGPRNEINPRRRDFHISFETGVQAPS
jgi:hypothetical protein